jgi:hypothetical protein
MINTVTLAQVEQLAAQLPLKEQMKVVAHITQRISDLLPLETRDERRRVEYAQEVEAFLKICDASPAETISAVDSAEDIRQIREERTSRL